MLKLRPLTAMLSIAAVAACVPSAPRPTVQPRDPTPQVDPKQAAPAQPTQPLRSGDWTTWQRAPGDWVYRQDQRGSIALFGPVGQDATFSIRCDRTERLVVLRRQGRANAGAQMVLRASQGMSALDARPVDGQSAYMAAGVAPASVILDQIAYSRGHFAVEMAGLPPVKIPAWPELAHVVEDCRS